MNRDQRVFAVESGPKAEVSSKYHVKDAGMPARIPGQHFWTIVCVYRTADPTSPRFDLDVENLLDIEGPCCFWCEQHYTPDLASKPCEGEPEES